MTEESRLEIHDVVLKESSVVGCETVECVPGLGNDLLAQRLLSMTL